MRLFRERVLARLVDKHAISRELAKRLLTWRHPGFSSHVGEPISGYDTQALENLAGYVTRNPLSLQRLVYLSEYDRCRDAATRDKFRLNRLLQRVVAWDDLACAVAHRLARRPDLADRLVGIAGDLVPARAAFDLAFLWDLLRA